MAHAQGKAYAVQLLIVCTEMKVLSGLQIQGQAHIVAWSIGLITDMAGLMRVGLGQTILDYSGGGVIL